MTWSNDAKFTREKKVSIMTALGSLRGESSIFGSPYEIGVKNHHYLEFTGIYHGAIIKTLVGSVLLKKLKYFKFMLNIFECSQVWEGVVLWLVYANKYSLVAELSRLRQENVLQSVTVLTTIISL